MRRLASWRASVSAGQRTSCRQPSGTSPAGAARVMRGERDTAVRRRQVPPALPARTPERKVASGRTAPTRPESSEGGTNATRIARLEPGASAGGVVAEDRDTGDPGGSLGRDADAP